MDGYILHICLRVRVQYKILTLFRKMYWLNSNPTQSIQQANLDGTDIRLVVNTSSYTPLVFTLDVDNERIYWIDKDQGTAMYSDLQGNSETPVFLDSFNGRTMAVYGNI